MTWAKLSNVDGPQGWKVLTYRMPIIQRRTSVLWYIIPYFTFILKLSFQEDADKLDVCSDFTQEWAFSVN